MKKPLIEFLGNFFILLLIAASLICDASLFIYPSLAAVYSYTLAASGLIVLAGILMIINHKKVIKLPIPVIFFLLLGTYILFHGIFISGHLNHRHLYLILSYFLAFFLFLLFQLGNFKARSLLWAISVAAVAECIICLGQYWGVIHSANVYFKVTGSWANPNVTAMFLALSFPALLSLLLISEGLVKKGVLIACGLILAALLMLKCRTAYIGAGLSTTVVLSYHYNIRQWLFNKKNRSGSLLMGVFVLLILIPLALRLYNSKKESADGRKLVWKVAVGMFAEKPFEGYGYGMFEHSFNLIRARQVQTGNLSSDELQHSGHVKMSYNEFLENAIEGGIVGLLLFGAVLFSLLALIPPNITSETANGSAIDRSLSDRKLEVCSYAGIVSFTVMSVFNFSAQAIPAMCLFVLYAALHAIHSLSYQPVPFLAKRLSIGYLDILGVGFMLSGSYWAYSETQSAVAHIRNKQAADMRVKGNFTSAKSLLRTLEPQLELSESYWRNYGDVLFKLKEYKSAIKCFKRAKLLTSNPELYFASGKCYELMGDFASATTNYLIAKNIEPGRFKHRHALMNVYLKAGDFDAAGNMAQEIITLKAKIPSDKVSRYKSAARRVMRRIRIEAQYPELKRIKLTRINRS